MIDFTQKFTEADSKTRSVAEAIKNALGKVCDLLDVSLIHSTAGEVIAAGATVVVEGSHSMLDLADINVDSVRLIVRGKTAAGGAITLQAYDLTNSVVLASVTVTTVNGTNTGAWTQLVPKGGDREIALRVVGDSVHAQTIYSARLQAQTNSFRS